LTVRSPLPRSQVSLLRKYLLISGMTNIGTAPCFDQVHVYIDTGYFTIALRIAAHISSKATISYRSNSDRLSIENIMDDGWTARSEIATSRNISVGHALLNLVTRKRTGQCSRKCSIYGSLEVPVTSRNSDCTNYLSTRVLLASTGDRYG
jgi:hypothetical protein